MAFIGLLQTGYLVPRQKRTNLDEKVKFQNEKELSKHCRNYLSIIQSVACVAGAKRGGRRGGRKARKRGKSVEVFVHSSFCKSNLVIFNSLFVLGAGQRKGELTRPLKLSL